MTIREYRPPQYISVTSENHLFVRGPWPRNTWADPRHRPTEADEKAWLIQPSTAHRKRITLRLMYSDGSWPYDAYENMILASPIPHKWLYGAPLSILERLCDEQFKDTALLQFSIDKPNDIRLLCFTDPTWECLAVAPRYDHFKDKCTYVLHVLPKYVLFARDDDDDKVVVLKIKLHDQAADIVKCLAEALGFAADDEILASYMRDNVPLSWLTLPHLSDAHDDLAMKVAVTKKGAEDVKYSYSVTYLQEMFEDLSTIAEKQFSHTRQKSDAEYAKHLRKHWNDLCADLILHLPKQREGVEPYHIFPKHGEAGTQYRRIGETLQHGLDETLKPFSAWSAYFKHCLVLLAQMTPGERPAAMNVLYWCVFVRNCQGNDALKTVCEAIPKDVKMALTFFTQYKKADSQGRSSMDKWNNASQDERKEIIRKGQTAHDNLDALGYFDDAKAQLDLDIAKALDELRAVRQNLKEVRKVYPREVAMEEGLKANIEHFSEKKVKLEEEKCELSKKWEKTPKLGEKEVMDLLYYEHFAFKQKCLRERKATGQNLRNLEEEDDEGEGVGEGSYDEGESQDGESEQAESADVESEDTEGKETESDEQASAEDDSGDGSEYDDDDVEEVDDDDDSEYDDR